VPLGKVILDYATLNAQRERLKMLYSHERIDTLKHIVVKLFIPGDTEQIQRVVSYLSFPVDIYRYRAIMTGGESGIIVEKIHAHVAEGKRHDYSSIIKIMGENVRSDLSFSHEKVTQENKKVKEVETALEPITVPWQHKGAVDNFFERGKLTEEELIAFFDFEKHINDFNNTHQESTEMERM
ncbi:MAG: hypothetical protein KKH94_05545, partial [Candidatus Omnitrophica bacterium]|nr:hypothetical protein [Candidatus Omnitrophota bacterium]